MGTIRRQREEALRLGTNNSYEVDKVFTEDAHRWMEEILQMTHGANNSEFERKKIEEALAITLSHSEAYFDQTGFPTTEEAQRVYDASYTHLKSIVYGLVQDGVPGFAASITKAQENVSRDKNAKALIPIVEAMASSLALELDNEESKVRTASDKSHENGLSRDYNVRLAERWVDTISEHRNESYHSAKELKSAVYKGLNKIEATVGKFLPSDAHPDNNKVMENAMEKLHDHLAVLMTQSSEPFVSSYRNLMREESQEAQAAADGIRVMAHELGIDTSLSSEIRKRRRAEEPAAGSQERRR